MLFGFAQQFERAIFGGLLLAALGLVPRATWLLYLSVGLLNHSMLLLEGPAFRLPLFNDSFFPAVGWYRSAPQGIVGRSHYVASPP